MNNKQIGGRGKKAPYETTHVRIPIDLKSEVEDLVEKFRNNSYKTENNLNDNSAIELQKGSNKFIQFMISEFKNNNLFIVEKSDDNLDKKVSMTLEEAIVEANKILDSRSTKKELASKLLSVLYMVEVKL
jgi:hypothetical protein